MADLMRLQDVKMAFHPRRWLRPVALRAIDGVSLSVERGETHALVGESGSGKTTLGRLSLRLLRPNAGRISFNGVDITYAKEEELAWFRRRAQVVFQDPYSSLSRFMSVYQILEEPLLIHNVGNSRDRRELVYRALEDIKLTPPEEFASKYPHMLSGGQRQKVGIARAVILKPDYIVADEPVSMVDASSRSEILHVLRDMQRRSGISFLYITHDMATAKHFSNRLAVMYLGRIVEIGPSYRVIEEPLHPYTRSLIEAVPEPDAANRLRDRQVISGEPPDPANLPQNCRFHPRCPSFTEHKCDADPVLREVESHHQVACRLFE